MKKSSIAARMTLAMAASVAITFSAVLGLSYLLRVSSALSSGLAATTRSQSRASFELLDLAVKVQGLTQKMTLERDPDAIEALMHQSEALAQQAQVKIQQIERDDTSISAAFEKLKRANAEVIDLLMHAHNAESHEAIIEKSNPAFEGFLRTISDYQDKLGQTLDNQAQQANARTRHLAFLVYVLVATSVLLMCFGSFTLVRIVSKSLRRLADMVQDIAQGESDVTKRLEVVSNDELGEISRFFNLFMDKLQDVMQQVAANTRQVTTASRQLLEASRQITSNSAETSVQANAVSQATRQVDQHLQSVSHGAEEMTSTIQHIADNAHQAAKMASQAVQTAQAANTTVSKLGRSSSEIGAVVNVITSIAQQTNLLALNATIEAARAGEAGKGFAVVANEVKELARQTSKATEDIGQKINAIQTDTKGAVEAIGVISGVINQINNISGTIATAVEEQSATTNEMTRNVSEAAKGGGEISANIGGTARAAEGTSARAQESYKAAQKLAEVAAQLSNLVGLFKVTGRDPEIETALPVLFSGTDANGRPLDQKAMTINLSRRGTLLQGIGGILSVDAIISLARLHKKEQFRVVWVGDGNATTSGQVGVAPVDPNSSFWDDVLEATTDSELEAAMAPGDRSWAATC